MRTFDFLAGILFLEFQMPRTVTANAFYEHTPKHGKRPIPEFEFSLTQLSRKEADAWPDGSAKKSRGSQRC
jgi:hypothetical protein